MNDPEFLFEFQGESYTPEQCLVCCTIAALNNDFEVVDHLLKNVVNRAELIIAVNKANSKDIINMGVATDELNFKEKRINALKYIDPEFN